MSKVTQSIQEKIRQRRRQLILHSFIYYVLSDNIISDRKWTQWSRELCDLQQKYPKESAEVEYWSLFRDFDGSTGFHLTVDCDPWVDAKAKLLLDMRGNKG